MTKEQEEAIRYVNFMSKTIKFDKSGFPYGKESLETILNMLKDKDAEIEILKRDFKIVDQECSRLERKEAKQDKMIDLMAEFIKNNTLNNVLIGNVCLKLKCNNEECHEDNWEECIKQYFERKATNDA